MTLVSFLYCTICATNSFNWKFVSHIFVIMPMHDLFIPLEMYVDLSTFILDTPYFVILLVSMLRFKNLFWFSFLKHDISIETYTFKILSFKLKIYSFFLTLGFLTLSIIVHPATLIKYELWRFLFVIQFPYFWFTRERSYCHSLIRFACVSFPSLLFCYRSGRTYLILFIDTSRYSSTPQTIISYRDFSWSFIW
jgi:hypothetical protein